MRHERAMLNVGGILLCVTMLLSAGIAGAQGTWTTKAPIPTPSGQTTVAGVLNGQVYALGNSGNNSNVFQAYDPAANTWAAKAALPVFMSAFDAAVLNNHLYILGGCVGTDCRIGVTNTVWIYDPASDTWTAGPAMPSNRYGAAVGVINGKIYVAGGLDYDGDYTSTSVIAYDPIAGTWVPKANMPSGVRFAAAGVIDGKLYVAGGDQTTPSTGQMITALQVYDPATDTWTTKAPVPITTELSASGLINGKLYVVGGACSWGSCAGTEYPAVQVYDPTADTWSTDTPLPTPMQSRAGAVVNGTLYIVGGWRTSETDHLLPAVLAFTPSAQCAADLAAAQQQIQSLQTQVSTLTDQIQTLTTQNQSLSQTNQVLTGQLSALQGQLAAATAANGQLQAQVASLTGQNQQLAGQVSNLQAQVNTLTTANTQLGGQVASLTAQNQALGGQVTSLQGQVNSLTAANTQLQGQVTSLGQQLQTVSTDITSVQHTLASDFRNPKFVIPGNTTTQMQELTNAILKLDRAQLRALYHNLGGK